MESTLAECSAVLKADWLEKPTVAAKADCLAGWTAGHWVCSKVVTWAASMAAMMAELSECCWAATKADPLVA